MPAPQHAERTHFLLLNPLFPSSVNGTQTIRIQASKSAADSQYQKIIALLQEVIDLATILYALRALKGRERIKVTAEADVVEAKV